MRVAGILPAIRGRDALDTKEQGQDALATNTVAGTFYARKSAQTLFGGATNLSGIWHLPLLGKEGRTDWESATPRARDSRRKGLDKSCHDDILPRGKAWRAEPKDVRLGRRKSKIASSRGRRAAPKEGDSLGRVPRSDFARGTSGRDRLPCRGTVVRRVGELLRQARALGHITMQAPAVRTELRPRGPAASSRVSGRAVRRRDCRTHNTRTRLRPAARCIHRIGPAEASSQTWRQPDCETESSSQNGRHGQHA